MIDYIWYNTLNKPFLTPPSQIFTAVWGVLYFSILISLLLFATSPTIRKKTLGYIFFTIQTVLNLLWLPTFFGLKNILLALVIVIALDLFIFFTIKEFYDINKLAGIVLIPYFLWCLFATYLTAGYYILN